MILDSCRILRQQNCNLAPLTTSTSLTCVRSQLSKNFYQRTLWHNYHLELKDKEGNLVCIPQIYKEDTRPHITRCEGIVRDGSNWASSSCTWPNKTNASTIFAHRTAFYMCLSPHLDHSRLRWHMHLINHSYFDHWKNLKTPNLSPFQEKMAQVLGSLFYICGASGTFHVQRYIICS